MSGQPRIAGALRMPARTTARRRLFCVPYAGGGAGVFRRWRPALADDIDLIALQLPGRESRMGEPAFESIAEMVEAVLPAIASFSDLPYALFGHSMGALVAFEATAALEATAGRPPAHLFVSARRSPDEPSQYAPLHGLSDGEFIEALQHRYGAIPEAVRQEPELLALLLPTLRADITAVERYAFANGRVRCPVHIYGGADDWHPPPSCLSAWQRVADRPVRVRVFDGDHFFLTSQQEAVIEDIGESWTGAETDVRRDDPCPGAPGPAESRP